MELDIRMVISLLVSGAAGYLVILFLRKLIEGIDKATDGWLRKNKITRGIGIVLDSLLPWLPCIPSGILAIAIMRCWPPDSIWNNDLLYFLSGAISGSIGSQLYYTITRIIRKQVERSAPPKEGPSS